MQKGLKRIGLGLVAVGLSITLLLIVALPVCEAGPDERRVRIGLHGTFIGAIAPTGAPLGEGIIDWARHTNEQGGIGGVEIDVLWEETGATAPASITAHRRFRASNVLLEASIAILQATTLLPRLQKDEIPITVTTGQNDASISKPMWVFTGGPCCPDSPALVCTWFRQNWTEERRPKFGAMIYESGSTLSTVPGLEWAAKNLNMEYVGIEIIPMMGAIDTTTEWLRLAGKKPDFIFCCICGASQTTAMKDAARLEIQKKGIVLVDCGYCIDETIRVVGKKDAEGWYMHRWAPVAQEAKLIPGMKVLSDAAKRYRGIELEEVRGGYILGWVQGQVMGEGIKLAIEKVGFDKLTGRAIRDGLASIKEFDGGIIPPITMSDTKPWWGMGERMYQFREGKWWPVSNYLLYPLCVDYIRLE